MNCFIFIIPVLFCTVISTVFSRSENEPEKYPLIWHFLLSLCHQAAHSFRIHLFAASASQMLSADDQLIVPPVP